MKKKILIIAAAAVLALSIAAGFAANFFAASLRARTEYKNELNSLIAKNEELSAKKNEIKKEISQIEKEIESKNEISAEAEEYANELRALEDEAEEAQKTLAELDESIKKKQEYIEKANNIKRLYRGRSVSLYDEALKCPDNITAGRYIAEGSGNLLVYNSSNKLRISENLSAIETNSFTFDLKEGETVKAADSVTLTTLK